MSLHELTASTPFRLTIRLMVIFSLAMLACFTVAFMVIRSYLDADLHNELTQEIATWQAATDATDLRERLGQEISATPPHNMLIVLLLNNGERLANVPDFGAVSGFRVVAGRELHLPKHEVAQSYLVTSAQVAGGTLILGIDREKVSELGEIFTMSFLLGMLPTLALAGGLGLLTAQTARTRVEAIRAALKRLTDGDLDARVTGLDAPAGPPPEGAPPGTWLDNRRRLAGGLGRRLADARADDDDLTQIGRAVNRMAAAQAASTASLRQVSADIAHDLKTPIQRVAVLLDLIEDGGPLTETQDRALSRARSESRQIAATFQSLLQIAQLEGGDARDHFAPVDLAAAISDIADVYAPAAEESGHGFEWSVPEAPVMVEGDRNLLGQIAANLIENGLRHTPSGSHISLRLDPNGVLTVRDDGPGIPAEERQHVLRRLYRLERSRTTDGSGLGLSLVAAIADLHDATLTLSDAGPGLEVALHFPLADATGGPTRGTATGAPPAAAASREDAAGRPADAAERAGPAGPGGAPGNRTA